MVEELTIPKQLSVDFDNQTETPIEISYFQTISDIVWRGENKENGSFVSLILINSEAMKELNRKYRGKNQSTDVLSFECEADYANLLGEIIIDLDTAEKQKADGLLELELGKLFLHGLLHLLGYDHISFHDKKIMEQKEKYYFNAWKNNLTF
ncbi:MAG: rRNA maturation RNase YbeY [Candidatus Cloacimonetes bacterium]|nr:rRNA maturation RNase YbeY [Candidatus Cloacimonadota bacterium]